MLERTGVHAFQPATLVALWPRRLRRWSGWAGQGPSAALGGAGQATQLPGGEGPAAPSLAAGAGERGAAGPSRGPGAGPVLPQGDEQPEAVAAWQRQALAAVLPDLEQRFGLYPLKPRPGGDEAWREALPAFIQYLLRARAQEGVAAREALDAALLHLLMDLGARAEAAAFASLAHGVPLDVLSARLQVGDGRGVIGKLDVTLAGRVAQAAPVPARKETRRCVGPRRRCPAQQPPPSPSLAGAGLV